MSHNCRSDPPCLLYAGLVLAKHANGAFFVAALDDQKVYVGCSFRCPHALARITHAVEDGKHGSLCNRLSVQCEQHIRYWTLQASIARISKFQALARR